MNKTKLTLMIVGGVCVLAVLVLGYLVWDAHSAIDDKRSELESDEDTYRRLVQAEVKPCPESIAALASNRMTYAAWTDANLALAKRGDRLFAGTTPPAFKTFMVEEAQKLSELPGRADGKLVRKGFAFGFPQFVTGGEMPSVADLPRLQREWDDVTTVVNTLAGAGVAELTELTLGSAQQKGKAAEAKNTTGRKNVKKPARTARKSDAPATDDQPDITTVQVSFVAHAQALVNVLNAFASSERCCLVDSFQFVREQDAIGSALAGDAAKRAEGSRRTSRRRRGAEAEAETQEDAKQGRPVIDSVNGDLIKVSMTVCVLDFKTKQPAAAAEEKEAAK